MKKTGVSGVISILIIIALVLVAIGVVWVVVQNILSESSENVEKGSLDILTKIKSTGLSFASCKDILDQGYSTGDDVYLIDPLGNGNKFEVYCDMTTDGGGWTLVYHGLATQAQYPDKSDGEKVRISGNIKFDEMMVEGSNLNHYLTDTTSETAVLQKTIPEYFGDVDKMPDGCSPACPRVYFHDTKGNKDVTLNNNRFFYGYGNDWRYFWACVDVSSPTYMYIGPGSGGCPPRSSFVSTDVGCSGGGNNYCGNTLDSITKDSGLKLSKREYQEVKVLIR